MSIAAPSDSAAYRDGPRLLGDVGGTHARFALETAPGSIAGVRVLHTGDHPDIAAALRAYLAQEGIASPRHAAIAIANPVEGDRVSMTNHDWSFSIEALRREFGFDTLRVINDFTALALALPFLGEDGRRQIGGGAARPRAAIGLVGPGTGLGVSGLIPAGEGWTPLASEGGHVSFSPADERELAVLQFAWREHAHVSAERLVSGPGLELVQRALAARAGAPVEPLDAPQIVARALAGDERCRDSVDCFCAMLGTVASNLALTLGALGGVYVGGGIVPRLGEHFDRSPFRARFEAKGRFSAYLERIPTYLITAPHPAFTGAAAVLARELDG